MVADDELDARPRKKVAAGKEGKPHWKTLVDAAPTSKAAARPPTKAAARPPTTPARAGQRDRNRLRKNSCKMTVRVSVPVSLFPSRICYAYIKHYF